MNPGIKLIWLIAIIFGIVFTYILMLALQPAVNTIIETANASTGNWTADPGFEMAQGVMTSFPVWQWLLPAGVGLIFIVMIWRKND